MQGFLVNAGEENVKSWPGDKAVTDRDMPASISPAPCAVTVPS